MDMNATHLAARRREAALQSVADFKAQHILASELLILVGSLAHGGFSASSDIDAVCVAGSSQRVLELVRSVGMTVSDAEFRHYQQRVDGRYCILNFRMSLGGIPVSLVGIDLACLSHLASGLESMLQVRNYLPPDDVTLLDYCGDAISMRREREILGANYLSNYANFVVRRGVWAHGSLVNKLISKPVFLRDGVADDVLARTDEYLGVLHGRLRRLFSESAQLNLNCRVLAPLARAPKFDAATSAYIEQHVYRQGKST
jgi:hypothetical protein